MPDTTSPNAEPLPIDGHWVASGLRMQVLVPLGLALVLLVTSFVAVLVLARMNRSEAEVARAATAVDVMLQERTSHEVQTMRSIMEMVMRDRRIESAFRARDRQVLTTRKSGHGFGLHGSALAAHAMGGTLTADSDGPGTGATFTLELPVDASA